MPRRQPSVPDLWLISDARNDAMLEEALAKLPRGSGFIYRHYHLAPAARRRRLDRLARFARRRGHVVILSGSAAEARSWGAEGFYGAPVPPRAPSASPRRRGPQAEGRFLGSGTRSPLSRGLRSRRGRGWRLITAHSLREIGAARRCRADAILLSPVFPSRSHPGGRTLGPLRFRLLAARAGVPVIALGGMTARRARRLGTARWAAIDGLSGMQAADS